MGSEMCIRDSYFPNFGNPNFIPEESENTEVELRYREDNFGWSLAAFENDVENLIQYNPATFTTDQISEAEIRGGELTVFGQVDDWLLNANLTVLRPESFSVKDHGSLRWTPKAFCNTKKAQRRTLTSLA